MNRVFSTFLLLVWGAWFGSLIGVFIAILSVFWTFPPQAPETSNAYYFGLIASGIFNLFERVQLGLAGGALVFAFLWQLFRGATKLKIVLFVLFALATVSSVVETKFVSPRINDMRVANQIDQEEFKQMHRLSSGLYLGNAVLILVAGVIISVAIGDEARARRK